MASGCRGSWWRRLLALRGHHAHHLHHGGRRAGSALLGRGGPRAFEHLLQLRQPVQRAVRGAAALHRGVARRCLSAPILNAFFVYFVATGLRPEADRS
jgi:hypothetical protein